MISLHKIWGITESSAMGPKMNAWRQRHLDGLGAIRVSVAALRSHARLERYGIA
jgi:hypothetical protein